MTKLAEQVQRLEAGVANEIQERDAIVHTGVLALLTKQHHFQVGVPGIAKSMLIERIENPELSPEKRAFSGSLIRGSSARIQSDTD